ncbi:MAG: hemerythrin domain-containing protein [Actinomycetota bacterium]|nr:hemerythrin domain-containing protein [Actinomycetota bacterium]
MANMKQGVNLISAITSDHRAVEAVFAELQSGTGSPQHRRDLADHVIAELVRHSVGEEQYVYPEIRRKLGDEAADHELEEHAEAEKVMNALDGVDPTDANFDTLVDQLINTIRHHVREEENEALPKLVAACTPEELDHIAEQFENTKKTAPTRPHPAAPDKPPANRLLGPGAGLIDRLKDALTGRKA